MKTKLSVIYILAFLVYGLVGCGPTESEPTRPTTGTPSPIDKQAGISTAPLDPIPQEANLSKEHRSQENILNEDMQRIRNLANEIQRLKNGTDADQADKVMQDFVKAFNPVNKSVKDIESLLGEPSERKEDKINYRFDTGYGGWMWTFETSHGVIKNVVRNGIN